MRAQDAEQRLRGGEAGGVSSGSTDDARNKAGAGLTPKVVASTIPTLRSEQPNASRLPQALRSTTVTGFAASTRVRSSANGFSLEPKSNEAT